MANKMQWTEAELRARALTRWEGEGGALAPSATAESIDESEMRILARLGAAILENWSELSADLQDKVVLRARTLGGLGDHSRIKQQLARLLEAHRDHC